MYRFVDRSVENLCNSGRFLLWAMRSWTKAAQSGQCPQRAMSGSIAGMGALTILPDFHRAMALINRHALEKIRVAPVKHTKILEDEAILIGLWRDLANAEFDRVRATLALLVNREAVAPISRMMTAASAQLIAAGFDLSELNAEPLKEMK